MRQSAWTKLQCTCMSFVNGLAAMRIEQRPGPGRHGFAGCALSHGLVGAGDVEDFLLVVDTVTVGYVVRDWTVARDRDADDEAADGKADQATEDDADESAFPGLVTGPMFLKQNF